MDDDKSKQSVADVVVYTGEEMSGTLDPLKKQAADDRSRAIKVVLDAWKLESKASRDLRGKYAWALLWFLIAQAATLNAAFFMIGSKWLEVDQWVANTFLGGVFTESSAMVFFIVKYLFSRDDRRVFDLIEKL